MGGSGCVTVALWGVIKRTYIIGKRQSLDGVFLVERCGIRGVEKGFELIGARGGSVVVEEFAKVSLTSVTYSERMIFSFGNVIKGLHLMPSSFDSKDVILFLHVWHQ